MFVYWPFFLLVILFLFLCCYVLNVCENKSNSITENYRGHLKPGQTPCIAFASHNASTPEGPAPPCARIAAVRIRSPSRRSPNTHKCSVLRSVKNSDGFPPRSSPGRAFIAARRLAEPKPVCCWFQLAAQVINVGALYAGTTLLGRERTFFFVVEKAD